MPLQYQTIQSFVGDPAAGQLNFAAGEIILIKDLASVNLQNGWGYGVLIRTGGGGWFPSSYVVPVEVPQESPKIVQPQQDVSGIPVATATPVGTVATIDGAAGNGNFKQAGGSNLQQEPRGVESKAPSVVVQGNGNASTREAPPSWLQPPEPERDTTKSKSLMSSVGSSFRKAGRKVTAATTIAGSTLSTAATQTGSFLSTGLQNAPAFKSSNTDAAPAPNPPVPAATTTTTTQSTTSGWFPSRSSTTSTAATGSAAALAGTQVASQTTTTTEKSGWLPFSSSKTTTTTTRTVPAPAPVSQPSCQKTSAAEKVAGSIGAVAAWTSATSLMKGNVKKSLQAGAVSAMAFAAQGQAAMHNKDNNNTGAPASSNSGGSWLG